MHISVTQAELVNMKKETRDVKMMGVALRTAVEKNSRSTRRPN